MQDSFLTTVLAGIIVALVGGIVAFYLGGVRERHKRTSEQKEEVYEEMRKQAYSVGDALENWMFETSQCALKLPSLDRKGRYDMDIETFRKCKEQVRVVAEQAEDVSNAIRSLREYYRLKRPYLDSASQRAFEAFDKQVTLTYEQLSPPARVYKDNSQSIPYTPNSFTRRGGLHLDPAATKQANVIRQTVHRVQQSDALNELKGHLARLDAATRMNSP
jgi:hypothetical protein